MPSDRIDERNPQYAPLIGAAAEITFQLATVDPLSVARALARGLKRRHQRLKLTAGILNCELAFRLKDAANEIAQGHHRFSRACSDSSRVIVISEPGSASSMASTSRRTIKDLAPTV